ncbi:MAG: aminopeptidase P family protein [Deltaproteobacteria bacterium]|nr:aminopeptidase P family protein [Deltaproteobacteria bacterium]
MEDNGVHKILEEKDVEGILFLSPENIRYLTGFSGSEGYLIVKENANLLLVDSRYITQAHEETQGCRIALLEQDIKGLREHIAPLIVKRLGFEAQSISVALFEQLRKEMKGVRLIPVMEDLERLRGLKTPEEIAAIKKAITIAEGAWNKVMEMIGSKVREDEVALELEHSMRKAGSEGIAFDCIVASGPRSALPHAQPTSRPFQEGDFILFDFGARYGGYCSDESCTVVLGQATEEQRRIYGIVKDAHDRAIERIKPGITLAEIDAAARDHITKAGHGPHFGHSTGHGVGLAIHEWPRVGKNSQDVAEVGMIFTVEPGIYIPGLGGVRIEDMVLVTADGCEVLTTISKDLLMVD